MDWGLSLGAASAWKQHVRKKGGLARKLKLAYYLHFDLDPALFS